MRTECVSIVYRILSVAFRQICTSVNATVCDSRCEGLTIPVARTTMGKRRDLPRQSKKCVSKDGCLLCPKSDVSWFSSSYLLCANSKQTIELDSCTILACMIQRLKLVTFVPLSCFCKFPFLPSLTAQRFHILFVSCKFRRLP